MSSYTTLRQQLRWFVAEGEKIRTRAMAGRLESAIGRWALANHAAIAQALRSCESDSQWDSRALGADERYVQRATAADEDALQTALLAPESAKQDEAS